LVAQFLVAQFLVAPFFGGRITLLGLIQLLENYSVSIFYNLRLVVISNLPSRKSKV
jgi:hypothetical protein